MLKKLRHINYEYFVFFLIFLISSKEINFTHQDFTDPSIIWEGSYRLYLNQKPYVDFGMPFGMGIFIIPLFITKIFGFGTFALHFSSLVKNFVLLFFYNGILKQFDISIYKRLFSILIFSFFITSKIPFYNSTALCFSIVSIYYLNKYFEKKKFFYLVCSSIFTSLTFFTKQDFGGLLLLYFFYLLAKDINFKINKINYNFCFIISVKFLFLLIPFFYYLNTEIWYWFNFAFLSPGHHINIFTFERIVIKQIESVIYILIYMIFFISILFLIRDQIKSKKEKNLTVLFLFLFLQSVICGFLSGSGPIATSHFIIFFPTLFFIFFFEKILRLNKQKKIYIIIGYIILSTNLFPYEKFDLNKFLITHHIHKINDINIMNLKDIIKAYKKTEENFFDFEKYDVESFNQILNYKAPENHNCNLLVIGETPYFYKHFELNPCVGHPLYYCTGTSFFVREIKLIKNNIRNQQYGIVIYQNLWGEGSNIFLKKELDKYYDLEIISKNKHDPEENIYLYKSRK